MPNNKYGCSRREIRVPAKYLQNMFKKKVIHCWCSVRGVGLHACCLACIPNLRHGALKHVAGRDNNQKTHVVRVPNSSLLTCHLRFRESHSPGKEYILYFCTHHTKTVTCSTPPASSPWCVYYIYMNAKSVFRRWTKHVPYRLKLLTWRYIYIYIYIYALLDVKMRSDGGNIFVQCHIPDRRNLRQFVCRPPGNSLRHYCTMIRW